MAAVTRERERLAGRIVHVMYSLLRSSRTNAHFVTAAHEIPVPAVRARQSAGFFRTIRMRPLAMEGWRLVASARALAPLHDVLWQKGIKQRLDVGGGLRDFLRENAPKSTHLVVQSFP